MTRRRWAGNEKAAVLFLLPGLIGFLAFFLIPFIISLYYASVDNVFDRRFVGFQNFRDILGNAPFLHALTATVSFIGLCVPLGMVLSLLLAFLVNKAGSCGGFFGMIFLMPLVIPSAATSFFWKNIFSINGALNGFLLYFGQPPRDWLQTDMAMPIMILVFLWKNLGYNLVLYMAGLKNIPEAYYEYAGVEGAGRLQKFRHITLVYLRPTLLLVFIMSVINSFKVFKEIYLIAGQYPHESIYMLQHYMNNMFFALNYQKLSTASYILTFFIVMIVLLLFYGEKKLYEKTEG